MRWSLSRVLARLGRRRSVDRPKLGRGWLALVLLWSLGMASGCARIEDQLRVWLVTPRPAGDVTTEGGAPQRFLVLNVDGEESRLTIEGAVPSAVEVTAVATRPKSPRPVSSRVTGQLLINPADLSRTSGMLLADQLALRLRKVTILGPNTLADLTQPSSQVNLEVIGDVTYNGETRPAQFELIATADITNGQLNGMRVTTARPLRLPAAFGSDVESASLGTGAAESEATPTGASLALIARPGPSSAGGGAVAERGTVAERSAVAERGAKGGSPSRP